MQLGQAKAFGMLNHHDAGFWHIHPHFHHRGTDQNLAMASGKGTDGPLFCLAGEAPVQQPHLDLRKHLISEVAMHLHGRAQVQLLRFLDQGKHHIGPLAQGQLLPDQLPSLVALTAPQQTRANRRTPGG